MGFAGAIFVFVRVQVLQSYPFYHGVYGNAPLFLGITQTVGLEVFSLLALVGLLAWTFSNTEGRRSERLVKAAGNAMMVFGVLIASIVYVETRLLWGELVPGLHVWQGLPGGGGYPWGTEQVAYNTCFIASSVQGDCSFLNYNELFWIALSCAVIGFVLTHMPPESSV